MNSNDPNDLPRQLSFLEVDSESQNIQRDVSGLASIEKSALDENQTLMEKVVDDVILEMAWTRVKSNRGARQSRQKQHPSNGWS